MAEEIKKENEEESILERTEKAVKKLEEQNKIMEQNLKKAEELISRNILGGRTEVSSEKPKEETPREYVRRILSGRMT